MALRKIPIHEMRKYCLRFILIVSLFVAFSLCSHAQLPNPQHSTEHEELNIFLNEFVWVTLDQSKIKLGEDTSFLVYHKNQIYHYRGYLRTIGKSGIILERGETKLERRSRNFADELTWIPYCSILSISKLDERDKLH